jgi:hypothetical protein
MLGTISGEPEKKEDLEEDDKSPEAARERIEKEFGKPEDEDPLYGEKKAPKPFKAMMHALEAGDKELAFQYARRYIRYLNKVSDRSALVADIAGLGAEIEGSRPREDHSEESDPTGFLAIYKKELANATKSESKRGSLDEQARIILERAQHQTTQGNSGPQGETSADFGTNATQQPQGFQRPTGEQAERALLYENHPKGLPVDPEGRLTLYYFTSTGDQGPNSMIVNVQRVADSLEKYRTKGKIIQVQGISLVSFTSFDMDQFKSLRMRITFPIEENRELARAFGVTYSPAVAVVAESTGEWVVEKGYRTYWYLDELLKRMSGLK